MKLSSLLFSKKYVKSSLISLMASTSKSLLLKSLKASSSCCWCHLYLDWSSLSASLLPLFDFLDFLDDNFSSSTSTTWYWDSKLSMVSRRNSSHSSFSFSLGSTSGWFFKFMLE
ncbi:hypothetical protein WICPIJ_001629 [Wickerhamomyces pijperi]|uniref:Uncharacterized protein n=1 Tax=Wickerhamomyces pijperi TaxID=599730 RepID=A0A9P8QB60_WICPI|nr:hypothetical protein WICPIJ_001629 [Wickerhamomyces pijperi]